jgi:hypothetical protein
MIRAFIVIIAATYSATAQTDFGLELLGRVRQHIEANLTELPDYTCQETMERSISAPNGQIEFRERLRLEVLFTSTGELFAWPGSADFTSQPLESWISAGAIGNGSFGAELRNLFVASSATLEYAGFERQNQKPVYRFNFHTPPLSSRYSLVANGKSAITAYSGSFWVNQDSLDIVRLEHRAEDIPAELNLRDAHDSIDYGPARFGTSERLLPSATELVLVNHDGDESRNTITFSQCRHYTAVSSISFNSAVEPAIRLQQHPNSHLPAGVPLDLRLDQPIIIGSSAAGDELVARLDKAVKAGGVSLRKGTLVFGRIRRLEQHLTKPGSNLIGLQFFAAQTPREHITFSTKLTGPRAVEEVARIATQYKVEIMSAVVGLDIADDGTETGIGTFRIPAKQLRLPRGFHTVWETK